MTIVGSLIYFIQRDYGKKEATRAINEIFSNAESESELQELREQLIKDLIN